MSDDQLNDNLKSRIREVFDHYEDDTADESWLLLREKFPEEQDKDRAVVWLWRNVAAVAIILTILNIGLWINFHQPEKVKIIIAKAPKIINNDNTRVSPKIENPADSSIVAKNTTVNPVITKQALINKNQAIGIKKDNVTQITDTDLPVADNNIANNNMLTDALVNKPKSLVNTDSALIAHNTTTVVKKQEIADEVAANKAQVSNSMQSLFDKEKTQPKLSKAVNDISTNSNVLALSVYEATYVNYAKGSNKQLNTGAGVTSDIRLSPNFSLSTGIAIAQNSLSYNNTTSANSPIPLYLAASRNFAPNTNMLEDEVPTSKTLNASLVGLDVPLNLKYVFNPQTRNTYISAGFSSGTFINETYNYTYNYSSTNSSSSLQDDVNHKSFDSFYFAQMLNLSFGVGYPLGRNNLIIEPFVKYPLDGLGDQHLLFGSGGLNLKFNFGSSKSK